MIDENISVLNKSSDEELICYVLKNDQSPKKDIHVNFLQEEYQDTLQLLCELAPRPSNNEINTLKDAIKLAFSPQRTLKSVFTKEDGQIVIVNRNTKGNILEEKHLQNKLKKSYNYWRQLYLACKQYQKHLLKVSYHHWKKYLKSKQTFYLNINVSSATDVLTYTQNTFSSVQRIGLQNIPIQANSRANTPNRSIRIQVERPPQHAKTPSNKQPIKSNQVSKTTAYPSYKHAQKTIIEQENKRYADQFNQRFKDNQKMKARSPEMKPISPNKLPNNRIIVDMKATPISELFIRQEEDNSVSTLSTHSHMPTQTPLIYPKKIDSFLIKDEFPRKTKPMPMIYSSLPNLPNLYDMTSTEHKNSFDNSNKNNNNNKSNNQNINDKNDQHSVSLQEEGLHHRNKLQDTLSKLKISTIPSLPINGIPLLPIEPSSTIHIPVEIKTERIPETEEAPRIMNFHAIERSPISLVKNKPDTSQLRRYSDEDIDEKSEKIQENHCLSIKTSDNNNCEEEVFPEPLRPSMVTSLSLLNKTKKMIPFPKIEEFSEVSTDNKEDVKERSVFKPSKLTSLISKYHHENFCLEDIPFIQLHQTELQLKENLLDPQTPQFTTIDSPVLVNIQSPTRSIGVETDVSYFNNSLQEADIHSKEINEIEELKATQEPKDIKDIKEVEETHVLKDCEDTQSNFIIEIDPSLEMTNNTLIESNHPDWWESSIIKIKKKVFRKCKEHVIQIQKTWSQYQYSYSHYQWYLQKIYFNKLHYLTTINLSWLHALQSSRQTLQYAEIHHNQYQQKKYFYYLVYRLSQHQYKEQLLMTWLAKRLMKKIFRILMNKYYQQKYDKESLETLYYAITSDEAIDFSNFSLLEKYEPDENNQQFLTSSTIPDTFSPIPTINHITVIDLSSDNLNHDCSPLDWISNSSSIEHDEEHNVSYFIDLSHSVNSLCSTLLLRHREALCEFIELIRNYLCWKKRQQIKTLKKLYNFCLTRKLRKEVEFASREHNENSKKRKVFIVLLTNRINNITSKVSFESIYK